MSDNQNTAAATTTTTVKGKVTYTTVVMDDGTSVDFAGKRKMLKTSLFHDDGSIAIRLDFVNGETRTFTLAEQLLGKYAAHGAEQKFGDEIAGLDDVDDCILAIDDLADRLSTGEWGMQRDKSGLAGTSILARALVEHSGKTPEQVKSFLGGKSQAQKVALRGNPALAPIVARLEAEKARKSKPKNSVDTESLLDELAE